VTVALKLRIGRRAAAQIEKADRWWTENRLAAPGALREDLDAAFSALLIQPGIGTKVANTKLEGVRRLHLGRVRYYVYYRVEGGELIVLSVWHSSRGDQPEF
jgi:plasmid stabilization system protein ParE